jgi:hypothetical protein
VVLSKTQAILGALILAIIALISPMSVQLGVHPCRYNLVFMKEMNLTQSTRYSGGPIVRSQ